MRLFKNVLCPPTANHALYHRPAVKNVLFVINEALCIYYIFWQVKPATFLLDIRYRPFSSLQTAPAHTRTQGKPRGEAEVAKG